MPTKSSPKSDAQQDLIAALAEALKGSKRQMLPGELYVGIRNISAETCGLPRENNEPEVTIVPGESVVIPYTRWQNLRKHGWYAKGMIERDDAVLGDVHVAAPPDKLHELHPDHAKNRVPDPHVWITSRTEQQIREDIAIMTSESSLRRLMAAADEKIQALQVGIDRRDPRAVQRAVDALPVLYQLADNQAQARLFELLPMERTGPNGA